MSRQVQEAVGLARRLVRSGKPFAVAIRAAADEWDVSTADVAAGLRGRRKRRTSPALPERCCHVPVNAYWIDD